MTIDLTLEGSPNSSETSPGRRRGPPCDRVCPRVNYKSIVADRLTSRSIELGLKRLGSYSYDCSRLGTGTPLLVSAITGDLRKMLRTFVDNSYDTIQNHFSRQGTLVLTVHPEWRVRLRLTTHANVPNYSFRRVPGQTRSTSLTVLGNRHKRDLFLLVPGPTVEKCREVGIPDEFTVSVEESLCPV